MHEFILNQQSDMFDVFITHVKKLMDNPIVEDYVVPVSPTSKGAAKKSSSLGKAQT